MKFIRTNTIIIITFLIILGFSYCRNQKSGSNSSKSGDKPGTIKGWVVRGDVSKSKWTTGKAALDPSDSTMLVKVSDGDELINLDKGVEIYTEETFGDVHVEIEFMLPWQGNSGIHFMGEYEVQIWDSYGKPVILANQWMGTIVGTKEPEIHPEKCGGEWQKFVIDFRAPRFDANGNKTENARFVKVELNGQVIHENVEVTAPTPVYLTGKESSRGPLMLQGFAGPVAFRNIKIVPVTIP